MKTIPTRRIELSGRKPIRREIASGAKRHLCFKSGYRRGEGGDKNA